MERLLLIKYGEINLKGLNRHFFIDSLVKNIKRSLHIYTDLKITKIQGRISIENIGADEQQEIIERLKKVFGIVYITCAVKTDKSFDTIKNVALELIEKFDGGTFKIEARRADKQYPLTSPEIAREVGAHILNNTDRLKVDVHNPDILLEVEIRETAYITYENICGESGLPSGTSGKGGVLLSGGIDSPVAAYLIAKRGMKITGIHFHSYPFTSLNAKQKVIDIGKKLACYNNGIDIAMISLTEIQQDIIKKCNETYLTVILRRFMLKCAERFCEENSLQMLVTGESLGQVASQTTESIICTDSAVNVPILRPVIAMDKNEIIRHAQHIDTYNISIEPYEDCCTIFVPKHPQTKPILSKVLVEEQKLKVETLIDATMKNIEIVSVK